MAELLFWPALLAYSEAAVAYLGRRAASRHGGRLATWGVRIGWLVQTALLGVQAARADGFPWSTWAGSLNLFVWLVVGAYLIWGCQPRYRLLGLAVMPLAVVLFLLARIGGGTGIGDRSALLERLPRPARRSRARGLRRLHARCRALCALPVAGTASQAAGELDPPAARTGAGPLDDVAARTIAVRPTCAHPRDRRRRHPPARARRRARRADGRHHRHLDACTAPTSLCATSPVGAAAARRISSSPASCSLPSYAWRSPSPTSRHEHRPRRHLAPQGARRAARARGARPEARRGARARRLPVTTARRSASRRATAPSSTSRTSQPTQPRRRRRPRYSRSSRSSALRSTGSPTTRPRSTSSASPPGSTRWSRAKARSSARCAPRTRRRDRDRCSTGSSARRCTRAGRRATQTAIGESPASVSSAAAALAQQVFGDLARPQRARHRRRQDR